MTVLVIVKHVQEFEGIAINLQETPSIEIVIREYRKGRKLWISFQFHLDPGASERGLIDSGSIDPGNHLLYAVALEPPCAIHRPSHAVNAVSMNILLYSPDNGVTRNFMPHLWMFLLKSFTPPGHQVLLIDTQYCSYGGTAALCYYYAPKHFGICGPRRSASVSPREEIA